MWFIKARNVNHAFSEFLRFTKYDGLWRDISPRGTKTAEFNMPFCTIYENPTQRVLFCPERDANPFFHFFESLWILAGRDDVEFLKQFNSNIENYSDDGYGFHGAYGQRLRYSHDVDQIWKAIEMLKKDPDSRRVVLQIWDVDYDLDVESKDVPCNDMVFLKIRDSALNMSVMCRSNDVIWGAYGANAVQFSMLQEFIAIAIGVRVGQYLQFSDSYHYYSESEVWKKIKDIDDSKVPDHYESGVAPYPIMLPDENFRSWLRQLGGVLQQLEHFRKIGNVPNVGSCYPFFKEVVVPMYVAWNIYKSSVPTDKNTRIALAVGWLEQHCKAEDWKLACIQWLHRRREVTA